MERIRDVVFGDEEATRRNTDDEVLALYAYHRTKRGDDDPEIQMWRQVAERVWQGREAAMQPPGVRR